MKKYQTRPTVIEAQQFKGGLLDANHIMNWINTNGGKGVWCGAMPQNSNADGRVRHPGLPEMLRIRTNKGWEQVQIGDYVIRDAQGKFRPCDSVTFFQTYENALAEVVDITPKLQELELKQIRPHA